MYFVSKKYKKNTKKLKNNFFFVDCKIKIDLKQSKYIPKEINQY